MTTPKDNDSELSVEHTPAKRRHNSVDSINFSALTQLYCLTMGALLILVGILRKESVPDWYYAALLVMIIWGAICIGNLRLPPHKRG